MPQLAFYGGFPQSGQQGCWPQRCSSRCRMQARGVGAKRWLMLTRFRALLSGQFYWSASLPSC
ncbi:hypothetical protein FLM9_1009 [Candidatus Synechococcus spongiarum]|uniref:Uncharacterized protein n=1 Tax=Candidatus Synechococcus spongiarum TaxID=431041 RepID=A0A161KAD8_9SYNE|nr:hypothetical protein FLM9_1009 [Candidatus Synechococcus spongiarum]